MNIPRHNFGYAVVDRLLYVIRGYTADDVIILNAEVYNPKTNKWSLMNCPHRPNFLPAFSFSFNSKLFVVGELPANIIIDSEYEISYIFFQAMN